MTSEQQPFPDYYEVLSARPDASDEELRAARREAVKRWHPDRNSAPEAEEMMRLVNAAWEVLGTPETRAEYDAVYFAWRAAEYARRAAAADEVRRGYVRERLERDEREASERYTTDKRAADDGGHQESGGSSGAGDSDAGARNGGSDSGGGKAAGKRDRVFGVILVGIVVLVGLIAAIAFARAGSETDGSLTQSEIATVSAIESEIRATVIANAARGSHTPTAIPSAGTIESTIGDGRIECDWVPIGNVSNFWSSATFQVPATSEWSVGFLYHNPVRVSEEDLNSDAATYVFKNRSSGPYAGHWTRKDDAVMRREGPVPLRPASALNSRGDNTLRIEVNERGSFLILNGELQLIVPVAQLNPASSRVQFCAGFFRNEASEYELRYSDLSGGAR